MEINWKIGVEIELMAPKGLSRRDLALKIAQQHNGTVRSFFHPQVEPSKVSGQPLFNNLTQGFEVLDSAGQIMAQCVDDLTLQEDCDRSHPPLPGWYRIVSDEARLLQLVMQQADPTAPVSEVLTPIAHLFGTEPQSSQGGMVRITDRTGAAIAIAAPLPGERERPCELITPPIEKNHLAHLESLLTTVRFLGFTAPKEGATHIHFDAMPLQSASVLANLVRLLWTYGLELRQLVQTNLHCRRLGNWNRELYDLVRNPEWSKKNWEEARQSLAQLEVTKYCDFNLKNIIYPTLDKHTFEVRLFPVWLDGQSIMEAAGLFEGLLLWAVNSPANSIVPPDISALLNELPISVELCNIWQKRLS
ncbi:MAG: amidoligase family protein [Methylobacter sp.]|nr:amidoligase family protein [Methylobacter sp.]